MEFFLPGEIADEFKKPNFLWTGVEDCKASNPDDKKRILVRIVKRDFMSNLQQLTGIKYLSGC